MMSLTSFVSALTGAVMMVMAAGCQPSQEPQPAALSSTAPSVMEEIAALLAPELGRANLSFAPSEAGQIVVLPPRPGAFETRSVVTPDVFDIWLDAGGCYLLHQGDGRRIDLPGISCRAA